MKTKYFFPTLFYFLIYSPIESKSANIESIIRFGDSLFLEGEYIKALNEFHRAYFFTGGELKSQLGGKMADCYLSINDFKMARSFCDSVMFYSKDDSLRISYEFLKILCFMKESSFGYALLKLNNLEFKDEIQLQNRKKLYQGICYFGIGQYDASLKYFMDYISKTDTIRRLQLQQLYENPKVFKLPNSNIAMTLSLIIPGTGQFYSGEIKEGLNSLLLLSGIFYLGTVISTNGLVLLVPLFCKYYVGGIVHTKQIADRKRYEKKCAFYTCLTEILLDCQKLSDISLLKTLFKQEVVTKENSTYLKNSESEMKVFFSYYFLLYKEFISSQDVDACVFYPSCSKYTIEVIDSKGVVVGLLAGFDRLLRCYPYLTKDDYPFNTITMKYYDPY